jgi:nucleotide-binding universal stress UspA family protein
MSVARRLVGTAVRADLHVVHATPPASGPDVTSFEPTGTEGRLHALCGGFAKQTHARVVAHLRVGDAAAEIARLARELAADLIVVGARRRKGLAIAWHRSLSTRLVRLAPCSVLSARPREIDEAAAADGEAEVLVAPPCEDCLEARRESGGRVVWCERHTGHHVHGHLHHARARALTSGAWTFHS